MILLCLSCSAHALLSIELTQGVTSGLPLTVMPWQVVGDVNDKVARSLANQLNEIVHNDLTYSGQFKLSRSRLWSVHPATATELSWADAKKLGVDNIILGSIQSIDQDKYRITVELLDMFAVYDESTDAHGKGLSNKAVVMRKELVISPYNIRRAAHRISDAIYERIFGIKGIFSTKLAYVVVKHNTGGRTIYTLEVADADGANPKIILRSTAPVMSPSWSKDGRKLAYVSFEKRRSAIYIQDLTTGRRQLLSKLPGINGAPAWSPDGNKLAVVLSMGVSPNIYTVDLHDHHISAITNDHYLNTEPAWSPDGSALFFTSNRSGGPQIYRYNLRKKTMSRVSTEGDYNARASITADGRRMVAIHRYNDLYGIAIFDLDTGSLHILTPPGTRDSSSPSVAPNGSMILYDTVFNGKNILSMVSTDGRVQLRLPERDGEAQDPAWSPFLT